MNYDSFALSEFDPAKAAYFRAFLGPSGNFDSFAGHFRSGEFAFGILAIDLRAPRPCRTGPPAGCCGSDRRCIERQTPDSTLKPPCLSITIVNIGDRGVPAGDGAFRYCDFWRSRRGSLSRADRRRHTKACAAQSDCWQCCHWSRRSCALERDDSIPKWERDSQRAEK